MLTRDFAAPLIAVREGFRAVSASAAVCFVPRTTLHDAYRREVRTRVGGMVGFADRLLEPAIPS